MNAKHEEHSEPLDWFSLSPHMKNFEIAFSSSGGGCRRTCECGVEYYNPDGGWTWDEGEIEKLEQSGAKILPHTVGMVSFEGKEFVSDCSCWRERADKIINWLSNHSHGIATFLTREKKRKQAEADSSPLVQ